MSRIGNRELLIPTGVSVEVNGTKVEVKGSLGTLSKEFSPLIAITVKDSLVSTVRANDEKHTKQLHGTTNSLIQGMIEGVSKGFKKELEIRGVGYKAAIQGKKLIVNVGFSHPVEIKIPDGIKVELPKPVHVIVSGISKEAVGQLSAIIRKIRKPSVYSGKGIRYVGEYIITKEGKAAAK